MNSPTSSSKETTLIKGDQKKKSKKKRKRERNAGLKTQASKHAKLTVNHVIPSSQKEPSMVLPWPCPNQFYTPLDIELSLIPFLIQNKKEVGMFKTKSKERISKLISKCESERIPVLQALSLRRHHIKLIHGPHHNQLGLGNERNIRQAAQIFENSIKEYMQRNHVTFLTEMEQRKRHCKINPDGGQPPTPDFLFHQPVQIVGMTGLQCLDVLNNQYSSQQSSTYKHDDNNIQKKKYKNDNTCTSAQININLNITMKVNWLEAKMFYGASSIPADGKSAVGKLLSTADKYVKLYGPGIMIFAYGCGDQLASQLKAKGVLAMDASPCDFTKLERQQRTWCSDEHGRILI